MTKARRRTIQPLAISASLVAPRAPMTGKAAVEQMADDFRVINTRAGNVTTDDLSLVGWTQAQIAKHGVAARELAAAQSTASAI